MAEAKEPLAGGKDRLGWWAIALCVLPLLILAAVFVFNVPVSTLLLFGAVLLCPILHLFMGHSHGAVGHDQHHQEAGSRSRLPRQ